MIQITTDYNMPKQQVWKFTQWQMRTIGNKRQLVRYDAIEEAKQ